MMGIDERGCLIRGFNDVFRGGLIKGSGEIVW